MNRMNGMNPTQMLQMIRNNPQMTGNNTVSNVLRLRDANDRQGLIELYKNTCQTTGNQPDPRFLQ